MRLLATALVTALAMPLAAQNCFWGDFGTSLGYGTTDTVYAIRPIGFAFPIGGASYTDIHVNDHGFVQLSNGGVPAPLATGSAALYTPTVGNFVAGGPKIAPLYSDMTLAGGGECWIRSTPTQCTVTWQNVQSYGIPSPRFSFQLQLFPTGAVRFVYGPGCTNNSTFGGSSAGAVVGVTPAGGVTAPASLDLSAGGTSTSSTTHEAILAAGAFDLANNTLDLMPVGAGYAYALAGAPANCATATRFGAGCDGLGLGAVGLPALGNAFFRVRAELVPAVSPVAFFAFGTSSLNPGTPLGPVLGMTGCTAYTNANIGIFTGSQVTTSPTGLAPTSFYNVPIPAASSLLGFQLTTQALALSTANPFGVVVSNGLELRIGRNGPSLPPNPVLDMVAITPGTFTMGSTAGLPNEAPVHTVTLTYPFWMGRYEVRQSQYQAVMGVNPSYFVGYPDSPQRPVEQVSWDSARTYCANLTATERAAGRVPVGYEYRLPTEAEWEYCCRAGTTTEWHTGASLTAAQANFGGSFGAPRPVGTYAPNAWGLYDMHGNVLEWCLDAYAGYAAGAVTDPFVPGASVFSRRMCRGGGWLAYFTAFQSRSAVRYDVVPSNSDGVTGFRVVLAPILVP